MLDGNRILAVVPARGGSKGVPLKNLRPVLGVPLVARVAHVIRQTPVIDRAIVSTDHDVIARVAREAGLEAPFRRPQSLSTDRVADFDVLIHALSEVERLDGVRYDVLVMLQPTSPMRTPQHVCDAITMLVRAKWDAVWTVSRSNPRDHPLKQLRVHEAEVSYYDQRGAKVATRQELEPLFQKNGAAYVMTRECLMDQKSIMGEKTGALVIDEEMVSIDSEGDFDRVGFLLKRA